jgi:hypothetical protein
LSPERLLHLAHIVLKLPDLVLISRLDKLKTRSYCQGTVEDGVLHLDILPDRFGTNASDAVEDLATLLDEAL